MEGLFEPRVVRNNLKATFGSILLTILLSFFVWVNQGCDPWLPFISDTDVNPISGIPFTIGLSISGLMLSFAFFQIGVLRERWLEKNGENLRLLFWNKFSMIIGISSGLAVTWIAFTPWHESTNLHIFQAGIIFLGATFWAIITSLVSIKMSEINEKFSPNLKNRVKASIFATTSLTIMIAHFVFLALVERDLSLLDSYIDSVVTCTNLSSPIFAGAAFFEWMMVFGLGAVLITYIGEIDLLVDDD